MSITKFAETHNLVAFLEKPAESKGFKQIVDFMNVNLIIYALTVNPTIYTSCIQQFWDYAKVKTVNEDVQIRALIDRKKIIVTKASIRRDLQLQDAEGTACLPNDTIFEELARMGAKTTAWNEFNSTMASAIICLANNKKFKFPSSFLIIWSHHKKIFVSPSLTKKKKQKSRRIQRKETEVPHTELQTEESIPTTSKDPLPSGLQRLWKIGSNARVESFEDKESLGDQEDASKQERMINNIDQDEEIALVNETQGRLNEEEMFGVDDLDGDEVIMNVTTGENVEQSTKDAEKEVSTADPVTTTGEVVTIIKVTTAAATPQISKDELTLAKTLIEIKASKPKTKGVIIQEPRIMVEPKKPLKKKDQIAIDEEVARKLEAEMKAKMEEEKRIAREKDKENMAMIKQWDKVQAKTDADMELAQKL
nr:xylulose kinase-1 [Tanacetum cinerariifolium]